MEAGKICGGVEEDWMVGMTAVGLGVSEVDLPAADAGEHAVNKAENMQKNKTPMDKVLIFLENMVKVAG